MVNLIVPALGFQGNFDSHCGALDRPGLYPSKLHHVTTSRSSSYSLAAAIVARAVRLRSAIRKFSDGDGPVSRFTTSGLDGRHPPPCPPLPVRPPCAAAHSLACKHSLRTEGEAPVFSGSHSGITAHLSNNFRHSRCERPLHQEHTSTTLATPAAVLAFLPTGRSASIFVLARERYSLNR